MITIAKTITQINPNAEFSLSNNDISTIEWREGTTPISAEDIQAKYDELVEKENNLPNVKASAKAKLIAGEALTEEEANTIVI
tara:strand:+ start:50 stop:298 length:249 start_codon:yes stop_codon:yes gene_type:complete